MTLELIQGSEAWLRARLGKVTASRISDVIATAKSGGYLATRQNYMAELLTERLTGTQAERFTNAAMQHGTATEPEARAAYELHRNVDVIEVGFVPHPTIADTGSSPDGYVGEDGLVEFKCPNSATHIETLLAGIVPVRNLPQMHWQMACHPERKWCDFVSYDNRLPEQMRLFIRRVERNDSEIEKLEREVTLFLKDLGAKEAALRAQFMKAAA